jgi:hypothetical protein
MHYVTIAAGLTILYVTIMTLVFILLSRNNDEDDE